MNSSENNNESNIDINSKLVDESVCKFECKEHSKITCIEDGCNTACDDKNAHSRHNDMMPVLSEEEKETNDTKNELIEQLVAYL